MQPLVVAGDFNQRIPRRQQPEHAHDLLLASLDGLHIATAGNTEVGQLIDHITGSDVFTTSNFELIPAGDQAQPPRRNTSPATTATSRPDARYRSTKLNGWPPVALHVMASA